MNQLPEAAAEDGIAPDPVRLTLPSRLVIASSAVLVGWLIWILVSAGVTAGLETLMSGDGRPGWLSFLVPLLGSPLGWGAGLAVATWAMRRRQRATRSVLPAAVPPVVVVLGSALVFWAGETRTLPDANGWWYFAVVVAGVAIAVVISGRSSDATRPAPSRTATNVD